MLLFFLFNTSLQSIFNSLFLLLLLNHSASPKTNPGPWCESLCHGITVTLEAKLKQKPLVDVVCEICEIKKTLFVLFCSMHRDRVSHIQKKWENKEKKPGVPFSLSTVGPLGVARSSFTATINLCPGLKIWTVTAIWQQKGYRHDDNSVIADWGKALNVVHLSAQWCWYSYRLYMSCIRVARFPKEIVSRCSEAVSMWGW